MGTRREDAARRDRLLALAMQDILHSIEEGVHIVDAQGRSVLYNRAMEKIEGLSADEVLGRPLLEVLPGWTPADSTLLTAVETGRTIDQRKQSYLNLKKKRISTVNTTFPIFSRGRIVGAVEIARNYTEVNQLSEKIIDLQQRLIDPPRPSRPKPRPATFDLLIGRHPLYLRAIDIARKAARSDSSVLIEGETGTGKELFAQGIHNEGGRRDKPFIAVNCAAIPDTLLEGILFGTTRGSFTGAEDRPGLFEQANGGTLFLDEINSLSYPLQAKILRALQEGAVRRVGGPRDVAVDARILSASNEPLRHLMREGGFRRDLYYRVNVINIEIPPLRERREDIPLLVDHFIRLYARKMGKEAISLSRELEAAFLDYEWIGNVRELQNVIESAMTMVGSERVLGREHLPAHLEMLAGRRGGGEGAGRRRRFSGDLAAYLDGIEEELIAEALRANGSNVTRAAAELGISRQSLQYKMRRHGLAGK